MKNTIPTGGRGTEVPEFLGGLEKALYGQARESGTRNSGGD